MTQIRSLLDAKIAASISPHVVPDAKELDKLPTALAAQKTYQIPLQCKRSGLVVGSLNVLAVAGHMPVVAQWKDSMVLHPLFSLQPVALLKFSRNTWFRYCNFTVEEGENEQLTSKQEQTLQVAALAMLHNLADVRQDIPWLPSWPDVSSQWASLMAISYWKCYLDSARFNFPAIHLSRMESDFSLRDYVQACWKVKKQYETTVNEKIELEKLKAAEFAAIALRDELAGARPTSIRQLWRWFVANMPKRYAKDLEGWMSEIFFSKGEQIRQFTIKDIDTFEEYFLSECPIGSSISHAFTEVIASKRTYLQQHFEAFEIIVPQAIIAAKASGEISAIEPQLANYPTRVAYIIAHAKWRLAHTNLKQRLEEAASKQELMTVTPSHKVTLVIREDEPELDDDNDDDIELDAADAADRDDNITGGMEE